MTIYLYRADVSVQMNVSGNSCRTLIMGVTGAEGFRPLAATRPSSSANGGVARGPELAIIVGLANITGGPAIICGTMPPTPPWKLPTKGEVNSIIITLFCIIYFVDILDFA